MRTCNCSGACNPSNNLTRREFLGLIGVGAAATFVPSSALGAFALPEADYERWRRDLLAPAKPRLYSSDTHTDARLHLGGIGTGNFEIGSDGQLTTWQLFNTLRDGHVPFHFLVKAGSAARLLQTAGGPDWPRVRRIEMSGEYPFARLQFQDPDLPIQLELTAFSPFSPLDARLSSTPLAAFVFRLHNASAQAQTVSLAALMQNPVGYDAAGENKANAHPAFGHNVNEVLSLGEPAPAAGLWLRAEAASDPSLDRPVTIWATANLSALKTPPPDRPANLTIETAPNAALPADKLTQPASTVLWLEEADAGTQEAFLRSAREAVEKGATLLFSGHTMPLLAAYASWTGGQPVAKVEPRPDIVFEDFEQGYDRWKVKGDAFGKAPATGTLPNQQAVSGFAGRGLVNTYLNGDDTTGRLTSKPFTIERRFIRFLIGGGRHARTQIRLVVDGKTVLRAGGKDNEKLEPAVWDVSAWQQKTAHIEIVDEQKGAWGHINIDQIEFSDLPASRDLMLVLEALLPARFSQVLPAESPAGSPPRTQLKDLVLAPEATQTTAADGTALLARTVGKGRVVLALGSVLEPAAAAWSGPRQRAYKLLCSLVGATYTVSAGANPKAPGFGTLALAALGGQTTVLPACEDLGEAWKKFAAEGRFGPLDGVHPNPPTAPGRTIHGAVASTVTVPAGGTAEVPFLLAWHYPNKYATSHHPEGLWMGCHYATQWADARAVVREAAAEFPRWRERTEKFRQAFYDSTLPWWLLDCLTANAAILRHIGVVFRIANGDVYGWEGSNGCCDPTCTHVWGYEQTLSRLFPDLEKEMRRIDFKHQQRGDGGVNNRTHVPSPDHPTGEQPFADGHASCILKAYREALNHPDESFFKDYWPHIKRAVEYLIDRDAKSNGGQPAGILQDDQWNTYDEALHGVTTFISGYYLAALRAGEAWATRMGDSASAERFHRVFLDGQKRLIDLCWNGEYFQQHLPDYLKRPGEFGPGCLSDQLIGQWWAHQLGLGYLFPKEHVVSALRAVFKYNFKSDLTGWPHAPRAFAGAADKGLIICTWPKGGRPDHVMLYSDEVWTGIEYQVAAHLIYEGLLEEGLAIVKAARDRYDGRPRAPIQRNPWNEIECGGHYARAMSSWSLLLALSGWELDGPRQTLNFAPRSRPEDFKSFFIGPEGWGTLRQTRSNDAQQNQILVREGALRIRELRLAATVAPRALKAELAGTPLAPATAFEAGTLTLKFPQPVTIQPGQTLSVGWGV